MSNHDDTTDLAREVTAQANGKPPESFVIPADLAQATLNYLASRSYAEVFELIRQLQSMSPSPITAGEKR